MADDSLDLLRRHLVVRSAYDALIVVKSAGRVLAPRTNLIVFLDARGRFVAQWPVEDSDDELEFVVAATSQLAPDDATAAFLISVRTGEVPMDRPGDEELWCELGALAEDAGIDLLDWFVVSGTVAYSVAEHAAVPAGWPTTTDALAAHPELRYDPTKPSAHRSARAIRRRRR